MDLPSIHHKYSPSSDSSIWFRVSDFWSRVQLSGFGCGYRVSGFNCHVPNPVYHVRLQQGFGSRNTTAGPEVCLTDFGFRVSGFGFRISGFGFRVSGFGFRFSVFRHPILGIEFRVSGSHVGARILRSVSLGLQFGFRVAGI